jgi:HSP20 family protein
MAVDVKETISAPATRPERHLRLLEPWDFLDEIEEEFGRFWNAPRFYRPGFFARLLPRRYRMGETTAWAPTLDAFESNGQLVIHAELPGVDKKDIHVSIADGDLIIEGERKSESEVKEKDYYRMERSSGSFYRRLPLPEGVKADQIQAEYKDGVLDIRMPKAGPAEPAKQIPVK